MASVAVWAVAGFFLLLIVIRVGVLISRLITARSDGDDDRPGGRNRATRRGHSRYLSD